LVLILLIFHDYLILLLLSLLSRCELLLLLLMVEGTLDVLLALCLLLLLRHLIDLVLNHHIGVVDVFQPEFRVQLILVGKLFLLIRVQGGEVVVQENSSLTVKAHGRLALCGLLLFHWNLSCRG
jgi:hypothetical protein